MHLDTHLCVCSFSVPIPSVSALGYTWDLWRTGATCELRQWFALTGKHDLRQSFVNDFTMALRQTQRDREVEREEEVKETVAVLIK